MQPQTETDTAPKPDRTRSRREGKVAKAIERTTSKIPSDAFLWAAGAAMAGSLVTQILGIGRGKKSPQRAPLSMFIGQWVPTLLLLGVYNKMVKLHGSDAQDDG